MILGTLDLREVTAIVQYGVAVWKLVPAGCWDSHNLEEPKLQGHQLLSILVLFIDSDFVYSS